MTTQRDDDNNTTKPRVRWVKNTEAVRAYRIWDPEVPNPKAKAKGTGKDVRGRYYMSSGRAHDAAMLLAKHSPIDKTLQVYNVRTAHEYGAYTRKVNGVLWDPANHKGDVIPENDSSGNRTTRAKGANRG